MTVEAPVEPYQPGSVELSVRADIDRMGQLDIGVRTTLKEMALKLARAFDLCETDDITALAKLNAELRQTLGKMSDVGNEDKETIAEFFRVISTPAIACPKCGHRQQ